MVTIRLARYGTKKRPFYRIVVADSRRARDGRYLEILGTYDPCNLSVPKNSDQAQEFGINSLKRDRLTHWVQVGAKLSPTVQSILKREKLIVNGKLAA